MNAFSSACTATPPTFQLSALAKPCSVYLEIELIFSVTLNTVKLECSNRNTFAASKQLALASSDFRASYLMYLQNC